ncbi:LLM class F420-dependent oxidoreductase [Amycolatopsis pigmentata]|uniref:LLM class F420-dependent oxidoreductase n=1 Tax=Amycolatopsis pigmentata TaxID=450801 RepID=A0ABW5FSF8_9PSEU
MDGFRFGVNMMTPGTRAEWVGKCRRAEALGYDVISVADHLGMPAPFPALVLAGEVTERVRLTTYVLNVPFYNPALLARDVAATDQFVDGRLELGLGAGYVKGEFDAAGLPFPGAGERIDFLERMITELRGLYEDSDYQPRPAQHGGPPLLLGGWGRRMLSLAARHADIIAFAGFSPGVDGGLADFEAFEERVEFVRRELGDRAARIEFNVLVQSVVVTDDRDAALVERLTYAPALSPARLGELPTLLVGTPAEIVARIRSNRERLGIGYVTVLERDMEAFAPVIELLRRS